MNQENFENYCNGALTPRFVKVVNVGPLYKIVVVLVQYNKTTPNNNGANAEKRASKIYKVGVGVVGVDVVGSLFIVSYFFY